MIDIKAQELFKNKLKSVKADFDEQDVAAYFKEIIEPALRSAGIAQFSILLYSRNGQSILVELAQGYLGDTSPYLLMCDVMKDIRCNNFKLFTNDVSVVLGYSENDMDWAVIKYPFVANDFIEPLSDDFCVPFFDFA